MAPKLRKIPRICEVFYGCFIGDTIADAIRQRGGSLSRVEQEPGLGRSTLYRKMKKYGL